MCGIAGAASRDAGFDVGPIVTRLTAALAHRGPDGEGFHFARGRSVGLGNRRLSIVDLPGGAQPIGSEDERVWVTYNGEIYNHLDLRRELIALGHRFHTNADTEVLVHGFEAWGAELFGRLNGIFAFALLDRRSDQPAVPGSVVRRPVAIARDAVVEGAIVGPYVSIAAGARVKNAVVRNAILNENATVEDVLLEDSVVGENAIIQGGFRRMNVGDSSEIQIA